MKSKSIKIIISILMIILLFSNTPVFATVDPYEDPDYYDPTIESGDEELGKKAGKILGIVNTVGAVCSVAIIAIIGIKYILGSVEEKAEYKKTMLGYIIGAILLFSASTLPNILYNIGTSIGQEDSQEDLPDSPKGPGNRGDPVQVFVLW